MLQLILEIMHSLSTSETRFQGYRLPRTFVPHRYTLRLLPIMKPGEFYVKGYVSIEMDCKEPADQITLHAADIKIEISSVLVRLFT